MMNEPTNICPDCNRAEVKHLIGERWKCQHPLCGHIHRKTDDGFKPYLDWMKAGRKRKAVRKRKRNARRRASSRSTKIHPKGSMNSGSRKHSEDLSGGLRGDSRQPEARDGPI